MKREGQRPDAILIAGPTAGGKSALAQRLACRFGGLIVNADSMQVYRDLRILTARPDVDAMAAAPHALYGHIDGADAYSVRRWLEDAAAAVAEARAQRLVPILVGGTGLYFKALTQGLSEIPTVPAPVRAEIRAWAAGKSPEALHAALTRRDPVTAARLQPTDPQRIVRALEVHAATGESLAAFQTRRAPALIPPAAASAFVLTLDRDRLRARIDRRFDTMVASGAINEVARLAARGLDPSLPVMRAIGVPPILRHLRGATSLAEAVADAKLASRQYIKRQETFVRNQLPHFEPATADAAEQAIEAAFQSSA